MLYFCLLIKQICIFAPDISLFKQFECFIDKICVGLSIYIPQINQITELLKRWGSTWPQMYKSFRYFRKTIQMATSLKLLNLSLILWAKHLFKCFQRLLVLLVGLSSDDIVKRSYWRLFLVINPFEEVAGIEKALEMIVVLRV